MPFLPDIIHNSGSFINKNHLFSGITFIQYERLLHTFFLSSAVNITGGAAQHEKKMAIWIKSVICSTVTIFFEHTFYHTIVSGCGHIAVVLFQHYPKGVFAFHIRRSRGRSSKSCTNRRSPAWRWRFFLRYK